jgi:peptide-methionine (S)-S-oxide reductase
MVETAYFGAGCFWHAEREYSRLKGVSSTEVGHCEIVTSKNKKAKVEVVKIDFNESQTSFEMLIDVFWDTHDPTSNLHKKEDYVEKSIIFTIGDHQSNLAKQALIRKRESGQSLILTEVREFISYKKAPEKDQKYYFKLKH